MLDGAPESLIVADGLVRSNGHHVRLDGIGSCLPPEGPACPRFTIIRWRPCCRSITTLPLASARRRRCGSGTSNTRAAESAQVCCLLRLGSPGDNPGVCLGKVVVQHLHVPWHGAPGKLSVMHDCKVLTDTLNKCPPAHHRRRRPNVTPSSSKTKRRTAPTRQMRGRLASIPPPPLS